MHHHLLLFTIMRSSSSSTTTSSKTPTNNHHHHHHSPLSPSAASSSSSCSTCKHSPSATLDLLIFILVLFSGTFLLTSYFHYIFHSLSLLLSSHSHSLSLNFSPSLPIFSGFLAFFLLSLLFLEFFCCCCGPRSRRCKKPGCKGLKKAMEFDLQLQTEDCIRSSSSSKEIDKLPWKGGSEGNPDYECLRAELRKMAPPNGRAVLLFRATCGCPVAKLEGWGPKRGRRHKKALANVAANGGDHR